MNPSASGTGLDTGSGGGGSEAEPESNVERSSNWTPRMSHGGGAGGGEEEEPRSRWAEMTRFHRGLRMELNDDLYGRGMAFSEGVYLRIGGNEYDSASSWDGAAVEGNDDMAAAAGDDDRRSSSSSPLVDESGA